MTRKLRLLVVTVLLFFISNIQTINAAEYTNNLSGYSKGGITFIESDKKSNEPPKHENKFEKNIKELNSKEFTRSQSLPQMSEARSILIVMAGLIIVVLSVLIFINKDSKQM